MPTTTNHATRRTLRAPLNRIGSSPELAPPGGISSSAELAPPVDDQARAPGHRQAMIREAAYFLAENRGFGSGHELEDWLAAEEQIDLALAKEAEAAVFVS